jgi:hypothetical protein
MPILNDIRDHKVLGREYKRGFDEGFAEGLAEARRERALNLLRRMIVKWFGPIPEGTEERLATRSTEETRDLCVRMPDVQSLEELLR